MILSLVLLELLRRRINLASICVIGCFFTLATQVVLIAVLWCCKPKVHILGDSKCPFWTPSWRSLSLSKVSLNHLKKGTKNCQFFFVCLFDFMPYNMKQRNSTADGASTWNLQTCHFYEIRIRSYRIPLPASFQLDKPGTGRCTLSSHMVLWQTLRILIDHCLGFDHRGNCTQVAAGSMEWYQWGWGGYVDSFCKQKLTM